MTNTNENKNTNSYEYLSLSHYLKLKQFISDCLTHYKKPCLVQYEVTYVNEGSNQADASAYFQNRMNRKGIRSAFLKSTEVTDSLYLKQDWFVIVESENKVFSKLELLAELHQVFLGLQTNGIIQSFKILNRADANESISSHYTLRWLALTPLNTEQAISWCGSAIKKTAPEKKRKISWSLPRQIGERSKKGRKPAQRACLRRS